METTIAESRKDQIQQYRSALAQMIDGGREYEDSGDAIFHAVLRGHSTDFLERLVLLDQIIHHNRFEEFAYIDTNGQEHLDYSTIHTFWGINLPVTIDEFFIAVEEERIKQEIADCEALALMESNSNKGEYAGR